MKPSSASAKLLWLAVPGIGVLAVFFLAPLATVFVEAAHERALPRLFASPDLWDALAASLWLGVRAAALSLVVGVGVAAHLARVSPRLRALLQVLIALPLTFSGLIVAYGFILLLGRAGFVTLLLAKLGADPAAIAGAFYGPVGLTVAYSYYLIPRVVLMLLPVFLNFDRRQLQAAESLGAPRWRAWAEILLPQVAPTFFAAFCLVAAVAIGAYGTALALVGTQLNILPLRLYSLIADAGADFPLASAVSVLLLGVCSLIMAVAEIAAARSEEEHVRA
ncbi:MAG: ABC transporter permease [Rhodospirillaceae bacterium]